MKEEIFALIHEGLDSRDFETRRTAKTFANSLKRTTRIMQFEKQKHVRDDGKLYLQQLVFMTKYLLQNPGLPIEEKMRTIQPKLNELEQHQIHQIFLLQHLKKARKAEASRKRKLKHAKKKKGKKKAVKH